MLKSLSKYYILGIILFILINCKRRNYNPKIFRLEDKDKNSKIFMFSKEDDTENLSNLFKIGKILQSKDNNQEFDIKFINYKKVDSGKIVKKQPKKSNFKKYCNSKLNVIDSKFEKIFQKICEKIYKKKNHKLLYKKFKKKFKAGMILLISFLIGILLVLSIVGMLLSAVAAIFIIFMSSLTCFRTFRKLRLELFGNYKNKKREYKLFASLAFLIALLMAATYLGIGFLTIPLILATIAGIGSFRRIRLLLRGEL